MYTIILYIIIMYICIKYIYIYISTFLFYKMYYGSHCLITHFLNFFNYLKKKTCKYY